MEEEKHGPPSRSPGKGGKDIDRRPGAISSLMAEEMGKPVRQAVAEIEKCADVCRYYSENASRILHPEKVKSDASESYIRFDPLGIVLAVMPWNFPFWQVFRFAAPALMAGNVCLLNVPPMSPVAPSRSRRSFSKRVFPPGVFKNLLIGSGMVEMIVRHSLVRAVTITGSDHAGRKVAEMAGRNLKKTVLELGGSDPFIVLADADLDVAVRMAVSSRMIDNGQSLHRRQTGLLPSMRCTKSSKLGLVEAIRKLKIGDPLDEGNDLGPLARSDLVKELDRQVSQSVERGARILAGGGPLPGPGGFYFEPTVISGVDKGMPAYDEELFGPVAALIRAENERDAIRMPMIPGSGSVPASGPGISARSELAAEIDSGSVFINVMVKSDPRLPFGGVKASGYGRELSDYGIKEFVNIKTVWIG